MRAHRGEKYIFVAIVVIVERDCAVARRYRVEPGFVGCVTKMPAAVIEVKIIVVDSADEQINEPVVVEVGRSRAVVGEAFVSLGSESRHGYGNASGRRNLGEYVGDRNQ